MNSVRLKKSQFLDRFHTFMNVKGILGNQIYALVFLLKLYFDWCDVAVATFYLLFPTNEKETPFMKNNSIAFQEGIWDIQKYYPLG